MSLHKDLEDLIDRERMLTKALKELLHALEQEYRKCGKCGNLWLHSVNVRFAMDAAHLLVPPHSHATADDDDRIELAR